MSWLANANYNYDNKYYLSASFRRDGSSRLAADNRWSNFWSVSGAWRISGEEFLKDNPWFNDLKLRVSYGTNGNLPTGNYSYMGLYSTTGGYGASPAFYWSQLSNAELGWEKSQNFNIGLEGALLDNRLRFSIEYFNKKTKDMLLNYPMALSTGFTGYDANVGNMRNWGWEFMVSGTLVKTKDVVWNMTWMGTAQRNKVLKLTGETNQIASGNYIIKEDYPLYTFYMPRSAGVDPATGQQLYWAYESMDDNGNVTGEYITTDYSKASASRYFQGDRIPDLYGSIGTDLKLFDCIDLSILTTYSIGGKILDSRYTSSMMNLYYGNTWNTNILRRWQNPGDVTDIPRVEVAGNVITTSNYLVNASYFAIKNITLGYTLPKRIARKAYLESVRLYASFDNVAVFSHLKGMDPQYNLHGVGTNYSYVANKNLTIGLDINF
jgi:hypothetical protein